MKQYTIYCLKEPDTEEIRYFGQTFRPMKERLSEHLNSKRDWHVSKWIRSLKRENKLPICEVLMTGLEKWEADEEEIALIAWGRKKEMRLTNLSLGGEGSSPTEETRQKMRAAQTGRKHTDESRHKMSLAAKGRKHTEETRQKLSEINTGKKQTPESVARRASSNLGKKRSEESRQRMSGAQRGKKLTEEHKQKIGMANKGHKKWLGKKHTKESRQKMSLAKIGKPSNRLGKRKETVCPE